MRHKNYKENCTGNEMDVNEKRGREMNKKGQVAIFVIIAIIIIGVLVLVFLFPNVRETVTGEEFSPNSYLKGCVEPSVRDGVALLSRQGGYREPEGFILHEGVKVKYLCYNTNYYDTCFVQQSNIQGHFESELREIVTPVAEQCARNLKAEYEKRGYSVSSGAISSEIEIIPGRIRIDFSAPMTITKQNTQTFEGFDVEIESEMFSLLSVSHLIIASEAALGDSATDKYTDNNPDLRILKLDTDDGSTVYKVGNVNTNEEFVFASRSLAWPAGFGIK
jgi:hypothetical protein